MLSSAIRVMDTFTFAYRKGFLDLRYEQMCTICSRGLYNDIFPLFVSLYRTHNTVHRNVGYCRSELFAVTNRPDIVRSSYESRM